MTPDKKKEHRMCPHCDGWICKECGTSTPHWELEAFDGQCKRCRLYPPEDKNDKP